MLPAGITERRRYFRLDDEIRLRLQVVTPEQMQAPAAGLFPTTDLRSALASFDTQIEHLLAELRLKEPVISELIAQLNRKYQYLADQIIADKVSISGETHPLTAVNISACGLSIVRQEPIDLNSNLHLDMILLPGNQRVACFGCIVACESLGESCYRWRVDFRQLSEKEQEMLIQLLVRRQTQLRRESSH